MDLSRLTGKLYSAKGGLTGFRIRVRDAKTGKILKEIITGDDGYYKISFDRIADRRLIKGVKKIFVEAVDAKGKVFGKKTYSHTFNRDRKINFRIAGSTAEKIKPEAEMVEKVSGSVLDLAKMDTFWTAMRMAYPTSMPVNMPFGQGSICPLPDIKHIPDLVDVAWDVIKGDPMAKIRMRESLHMLRKPETADGQQNIFRQIAIQGMKETGVSNFPRNTMSHMTSSEMAYTTMSHLTTAGGFGNRPVRPFNRPCFLSKERFLPVAIATVLSARSRLEVFTNLADLEDGLCGLGRMNSMLEAATTVVRGGDIGRFRGMVGLQWGECGPDDGPLPDPFPDPDPGPDPGPGCPPWPQDPEMDWCFHERIDCIREIIAHMATMGSGSANTYTITDISPDEGCPGTMMTITGSGFGNDGGKVRFRSVTSGSVIAEAATWSDTQVTVIVPGDAGSGPVSMEIVDETKIICGRVFTVYRDGNALHFEGDTARVTQLTINGRRLDLVVAPGENLTIAWGATHDDVDIKVKNASGTAIYQRLNRPATGSDSGFNVPTYTNETTLSVEATVTSPCGTHTLTRSILITVAPELTIEGAEFTQGVQRYWREGVSWNSIPTISGKDTIVRVYVSCDRNGFENDEVEITGILHVDGMPHYPINGSSPDPASDSPDPFITARPSSLIQRQETDHTLNFRIPAARCSGTKNIRISVFTDPSDGRSVRRTMTVSRTWTDNGVLKVRFVRIRDDSQSPATARPTEEQCRFSIERALDLMPTSPTDIGPAWQPTWNTGEDFTNDDDDLRDLLNDLNDEHNCNAWEWLWDWTGLTDCPDDDNAIWVGFSSSFNRGIGKRPGNTCISAVYNIGMGQGNMLRIKTAHEIGHNLGMKHIDVGGAGDPFYDHPDGGSLLDVPFDPFWNTTIDLSSVTDFMGYGSPRWSSADSWSRMIGFI